MAQRHPLTVHVPIRGQVLVRLDGTEVLHEVGEFAQQVPVVFTADAGEVSFQFDPKFWQGAVKGGSDPRPPASEAYDLSKAIALEVLKRYFQDGDASLDQIADDIALALRDRGLT